MFIKLNATSLLSCFVNPLSTRPAPFASINSTHKRPSYHFEVGFLASNIASGYLGTVAS